MRISAIYRPDMQDPPAMRRVHQGFTLLELMVVLSLIGLLTAVALPNLVRLYDSVSSRLALDEIIDEVNGLGFRAHQQASAFVLSDVSGDDAVSPVKLPPGWTLRVDEPIVYERNGACSGGRVRLFFDGELILARSLARPFCRLKDS